jgi:hypothetical protein
MYLRNGSGLNVARVITGGRNEGVIEVSECVNWQELVYSVVFKFRFRDDKVEKQSVVSALPSGYGLFSSILKEGSK